MTPFSIFGNSIAFPFTAVLCIFLSLVFGLLVHEIPVPIFLASLIPLGIFLAMLVCACAMLVCACTIGLGPQATAQAQAVQAAGSQPAIVQQCPRQCPYHHGGGQRQ